MIRKLLQIATVFAKDEIKNIKDVSAIAKCDNNYKISEEILTTYFAFYKIL